MEGFWAKEAGIDVELQTAKLLDSCWSQQSNTNDMCYKRSK